MRDSRALAGASSVRPSLERIDVHDDQPVTLQAHQVLVQEVAQQPVHALPRPTDHAGQIGLGERPVEGDAPLGVRLAIASEARQARRQAPREVKEVELLDVPGETAELEREVGEERIAQRRLLVEEDAQRGPVEDEGLGRHPAMVGNAK